MSARDQRNALIVALAAWIGWRAGFTYGAKTMARAMTGRPTSAGRRVGEWLEDRRRRTAAVEESDEGVRAVDAVAGFARRGPQATQGSQGGTADDRTSHGPYL